MEYSEAWRSSRWSGSDGHLTILIDEDATIGWLGRAQGGRRVTSRDRAVHVSEIVEIDERPPVAALRQIISPKHNTAIEHRGILTPAAGAAVLDALRELLPPYRNLIDHLSRRTDAVLPPGARGELLNEERDGVGVLLDIAGIDRKVLRSWHDPMDDVPFLRGMANYAEREDQLINYDVDRFAGWVDVPNVRAAWRTFRDRERRVFVMNANRTPVEQTLGVDVVYYSQHSRAFVLVQYKRMSTEQGGAHHELFYRPDQQLEVELERMEAVDAMCREQPGDFRLLATACWLKLCDPDPKVDDAASLIKGMYFAREHFVDLLKTCKGPKGGTRIGYSNVPRYLNNTEFTGLVRDGWIGSRGPATDKIARLVRESLETGHAVVVGVGSGPDEPLPRRRRRR